MRKAAPLMFIAAAAIWSCGVEPDQTAEKACENATCPPGTAINLSASSIEECQAGGSVNTVAGSGSLTGKCFTQGTCEYVCIPSEECCGEVLWTQTSYACSQVCCADGMPPPCQTACGDDVCEPGEVCAESSCPPGGTCSVCPDDCCAVCGNGVCEWGEDPTDCKEDCTEDACVPDCEGKECGDDGCGGSCGSWCGEGMTCFVQAGTCVPESCEPDCIGKECGNDGCGAICGTCSDGEPCTGGQCGCVQACTGRECGDDGCGGSCGPCVDSRVCNEQSGTCDCPPDTTGCGVTCCVKGAKCFDGACCTGKCDGKECGHDGCGGSCGNCGGQELCSDGKCQCVPDCSDKECGDNGCGGSCGQCGEEFGCKDGKCACVPVCGDKACGGDGCGGNCGSCADGEACLYGHCVVAGGPCGDGNEIDWDGCTGGQITEFLVNSYTTGAQSNPAACTFDDGSYVIVWQSDGQDGDGPGVFGKRLSVSGEKLTGDFQVNTYSNGSQSEPDVDRMADGGFIVVWPGEGPEDTYGVYARHYDADNKPAGAPFLVNVQTNQPQSDPQVATLTDGTFVVVWGSHMQDGDWGTIVGRRLSTNGQPEGGEFIVNTYWENSQINPAVSAAPDGGFAIVWQSGEEGSADNPQEGLGGSSWGVFGQLYDHWGDPTGLGEFMANVTVESDQWYPDVAFLQDGSFVISWETWGPPYSIVGRQFDAAGLPATAELPLHSQQGEERRWVRIDSLTSGGFVATWQGEDDDSYGIQAAVLGDNMVPPVAEFQVNMQQESIQTGSNVAAFSDGSFIVLWHSQGQQIDSSGVFAQRFLEDGTRVYR